MAHIIACVLLLAASVNAGSWRVINKNVATIDMGVAFISAQVGYTAGTMNGQGPAILKSVDGGVTFTPCNVTSFGADIMLMDVDAAGNSVVVSSIGGELYSNDGGATFHLSMGGGLSQSVRHIGAGAAGAHKYACTGDYTLRKANGVAISVNDGKTFSVYDANLTTMARYGAFPTTTSWFVAAGDFPSDPPPPPPPPAAATQRTVYPPLRAMARKSRIFNSAGQVTYRPRAFATPARVAAPSNDGGYAAELAHSKDGGITWTSQLQSTGAFYFNGIDCSPTNPDHCCAVGEGFNDASGPSTEPGGRIHCTTNGGQNWTRTFWQPENATMAPSLFEIRFVSDTEIWVCGGVISRTELPMFMHSLDGGITWTQDIQHAQVGALAVSLSFPTPTVGYAVILNGITQSSSVMKYI